MCGIFGVLGGELTRHVANHRCAFANLQRHRGPDDEGWLWLDERGAFPQPPPNPCAVFIHHRLSVLDPSPAGRQPMSTIDRDGGELHLLYNGEIYNHVELRRELEKEGCRFRSHCDTEVLLNAWDRWGEGALDRIIGMFAFALIDMRRRTLTLARDAFGIKPLHYAILANGGESSFAFASEIKTLLDLPGVSRIADPQQTYDYLAWGLTDHDDHTFFRDIRRLPAGAVLTIELDNPANRSCRFIKSKIQNLESKIEFADAAAQVRETFLDSVRLHLRSDVSVGCALSGGIDSSSILAAVRHIGGRDMDIHCFSHIADDARLNEERWIRTAADSAGATLHCVQPTADEMARDLDALIAVQDEPFASTSIYAQYRVFQLAQQRGVKVMLGGQGADELLAGYKPLLAGRLATLLRHGKFIAAGKFWRHLRRDGEVNASREMARALWLLAKPVTLRTSLSRRRIRSGEWLRRGWFADRNVCGRQLPPSIDADPLRTMLHDALFRVSLPALLRYEDRNSMAFSIESRVPFVSMPVVSLLKSMPEEFLISDRGVTKHVFREAMRGLVPQEILNRRDKIGFATPEASWMRSLTGWGDAILNDESQACCVLQMDSIRGRWRSVIDGRGTFDSRLWRCLNLIRWADLRQVQFE